MYNQNVSCWHDMFISVVSFDAQSFLTVFPNAFCVLVRVRMCICVCVCVCPLPASYSPFQDARTKVCKFKKFYFLRRRMLNGEPESEAQQRHQQH